MNSSYFSIYCLNLIILFHLKLGLCSASEATKVRPDSKLNLKVNDFVFIILDQNEETHVEKANNLKNNLLESAALHHIRVSVKLSSEYQDAASWIYLPWPDMLIKEKCEGRWYIFIEETCGLDISKLIYLLQTYDEEKELFFGKELYDAAATIIHHFESVKKTPFLYPDPRTGIIISQGLMKRIASEWDPLLTKIDFSIDAPYELAKFIFRLGVSLKNLEELCIEREDSCSIWVESSFSSSARERETQDVPLEKIHFAVKTCQKFSDERLPVLRETWIQEVPNYGFYSDVEDSRVNIQSFNIPNAERGHCMKTLAIIHHAAKKEDLEWLVIADDDTLLSPFRLSSFLGRYRSSSSVAIGERYAYMISSGAGFNYLTGGAGMVFSKETVSLLSKEGVCVCPSNETPDDMFLGSCLQRHQIPIIHSRRFHQARSEDYPVALLKDSSPISFHKFWMVDPREMYRKWLRESTWKDFEDKTARRVEL